MIQIDMEMPKCCNDCKFVYDEFKCMLTNLNMDWNKFETERQPACPLQRVGEKNLFPPTPKRVMDFENMAVDLIDDGVCSWYDLQDIIRGSIKIMRAEEERQYKAKMKYYEETSYKPSGGKNG